jgi:hypothetical protein
MHTRTLGQNVYGYAAGTQGHEYRRMRPSHSTQARSRATRTWVGGGGGAGGAGEVGRSWHWKYSR